MRVWCRNTKPIPRGLPRPAPCSAHRLPASTPSCLRLAPSGVPRLDGARSAAEPHRLFRLVAEVHSPLLPACPPAGSVVAPVGSATVGSIPRPSIARGCSRDAAVAESRPHLASAARHHGPLDPLLCRGLLSVVCLSWAIPLLWQTLEHLSSSFSAEAVIVLLHLADRLLAGFSALTVLADAPSPLAQRPLPLIPGCASLGWWRPVQSDHSRSVGITAADPWYLVSSLYPSLDLVWTYGQRVCYKQLFRDQKSGIFHIERSGLRDPPHIDRLPLLVSISVLISSLLDYAFSLAVERCRVDLTGNAG